VVEVLPDGTWLAYLQPSHPKPPHTERLLIRVIEYSIDDPALFMPNTIGSLLP
jgi:hypothetical protein